MACTRWYVEYSSADEFQWCNPRALCLCHNAHQPQAQLAIGNDLETIGVKHIGLSVDNLDEFHAAALSWSEPTDIVMGRTGLRYCFIKDPDGNWVEIVEDKRNLVPGMAVVDMSSL